VKIKIAVPATSANLGPGFDTLGLALKVYNYLEVDLDTDQTVVEITGSGSAYLPTDKTNLVYKAAAAVFKTAGKTPPPLRIKQENHIPPASGLGSSAAAVVGGMFAANALLKSPFSPGELLNLAVEFEGHPDNAAPALLGGLVVSGIDRDQVIWQKVAVKNPPQVVIIAPEYRLKTAESRSMLPREVAFSDAVGNLSRLAFLLNCFTAGDYTYLRYGCEDFLHQNYRAELIPGFQAAISACYQAGGLGAALSGAGPCVIAFAKSDAEKVATRMLAAFGEHGIKSRAIITGISDQGASVV